jgi:VWFA-related protein
MRRRELGWLVAGTLLAAGIMAHPVISALAAKQPSKVSQSARSFQPQIGDQGGIRVQVNLVDLFATVRDKKTKAIIPNLTQDDFQITEDGKPQKIAYFSNESKLPITLAMLLDTSGSEQYTLGAEQEAAQSFFARVMRKGDLSMLISFDSDADMLADFTDDQGVLGRAIRRARINEPGAAGPLAQTPAGTVFYDAVYLACHDKLASEAGRKAVIVLSDAQDEGSRLNVQDAIEAAQRSDTVVHVLLIGDPQHFNVNEGVAKKITDETGGRTIVVRSEKNLQQAFDQISEELRSQYTVGYYSTNTAHDGTYRKVKVEMTGKNMEALTRRGYYAPQE